MRSLILLAAACVTYQVRAFEVCDGLDQDADGTVDEAYDGDGDGYYRCGPTGLADCDDTRAEVHPGAGERCDGLDGDCDGALPGWEADADGDGARVCDADCDDADAAANLDDADGDGWDVCAGDCDDADPTRYPGAAEACDGLDGDCDGEPGEDEADVDGDGQAACAGDCDDTDPLANALDLDGDGAVACGAFPDCDDLDALSHPGAYERCDGRDNDCDGEVDDACR